MKLTTNKKELLEGIKTADRAVSNRQSLPVLSHVLLEVPTGDSLRISGTNLEVFITATVAVTASDAGACAAPADRLLAFLKDLKGNPEVELETKGSTLEIRAAGCKATFETMKSEDFPVIPPFEFGKAVSIKKDLLAELFGRTISSVSTDQTRYTLNGVYLEFVKAEVTATGTDGRRLATLTRASGLPKESKFTAIVPTSAASEVLSLARKKTTVQKMLVRFEDDKISFSDGATFIHARLIEGHFPNFRQVIPKNHTRVMKLNREAFITGVRQAANGSLRERGISVDFILERNLLRLKGMSRGHGTEAEVTASYDNQKPMTFRLNPVYVLNALNSLDSESVLFLLETELNPGVIAPADGAPATFVLMPMK